MKRVKYLIVLFVFALALSLIGCQKQDEAVFNKIEAPASYSLMRQNGKQIDAFTMTNNLSQNAMSGVITIYSEYYSKLLGFNISGSSISQGSGFVFHYSDGVYYALTNSHVVRRDDAYTNQDIYVEDYKGNRYTAEIYKKPTANGEAISANYDLACICFKAEKTMNVFEFASYDPSIGDEVVLLGSPAEQKNTILYGKVDGYITPIFEEKNDLNIEFEVVRSNIDSTNGSSGGALLDGNMRLVGVHFGGGEQGNSKYSGAIPVTQVRKFLNLNVWS